MHHEVLRELLGMFEAMGGAVMFRVAGIKLKIDNESEEQWVEVHEDRDPHVLTVVMSLVDDMGYEPMPEWECPSEEMPDGALRHWLAEKEDAYDVAVAV